MTTDESNKKGSYLGLHFMIVEGALAGPARTVAQLAEAFGTREENARRYMAALVSCGYVAVAPTQSIPGLTGGRPAALYVPRKMIVNKETA